MLKEFVSPLVMRPAVNDVAALIKRSESGNYLQKLSLEWMIVANFIPTAASRVMHHLVMSVVSLVTLYYKDAYLNICLSLNASVQLTGYSIALLPSFIGTKGFGLVALCQNAERRLALKREIENVKADTKRKDWIDDAGQQTVLDQVDIPEKELNSLGYLTIKTLKDFSRAYETFNQYGGSEVRKLKPPFIL